jgi:hypothetical protein
MVRVAASQRPPDPPKTCGYSCGGGQPPQERLAAPIPQINPQAFYSSLNMHVGSSTDDNNLQERYKKMPHAKAPHTKIISSTEKPLLPVMNPVYNMREICKQSILLEDHLSHPEKRCGDCCIKHFLTLEALAEEAITLDKKNEFQSRLESLPCRMRELQMIWYEDPVGNAHRVSQQLREIRKDLQMISFPVIFVDPSVSTPSCRDGVCSLPSKKKPPST